MSRHLTSEEYLRPFRSAPKQRGVEATITELEHDLREARNQPLTGHNLNNRHIAEWLYRLGWRKP